MSTNDKAPRCPLCNASGRFFYTLSERQASYYRCTGCGVIWLEKSKWPEQLDAHYSAVYYTDAYAGRPDAFPSFAYRLSLIERLIPAGGKIVEVGAASGEFLYLLKSRGYQVAGVELSSSAVTAGKARYDVEIYQGTLHDAPIRKASVDAVVLYHVFEHLPDPASFLSDASWVLKPGGLIIIEVPDPASIDARFSPTLMRSVLDFPHHLFSFTPHCLRGFLTRAGFEVILKESSAPYVLMSLLRRPSAEGKRPAEEVPKEGAPVKSVSVARERALKAFSRRVLGTLLPGMKLIIVARKPVV